MTKRTQRTHSPGFKAKVALAAIKGEKTLAELATLFDAHPHRITGWKAQPQEGAAGVFGRGAAASEAAASIDRKRGHGTRLPARAVNVLGRPGAGSFGPTLWLTLAMTRRAADIDG